MTSDLQGLLDRVAKATGPDSTLDRDLNELIRDPESRNVILLGPITGSIDAALALLGHVLPGWWWHAGDCSLTHDARLAPAGASSIGPGYALSAAVGPDFRASPEMLALLRRRPDLDAGFDVTRTTGNVALALIEAMLQAKIALGETHPVPVPM